MTTRPATSQSVHIVRTIPDIRALDLGASRDFYVDLLGFRQVMDMDGMLMLASPSDRRQQLTLHGDAADAAALPPGFSVDVGFPEDVTRLHDQAVAEGRTIVEPLADKAFGIRRFSLLDPGGTRVTVVAHTDPAHQPAR